MKKAINKLKPAKKPPKKKGPAKKHTKKKGGYKWAKPQLINNNVHRQLYGFLKNPGKGFPEVLKIKDFKNYEKGRLLKNAIEEVAKKRHKKFNENFIVVNKNYTDDQIYNLKIRVLYAAAYHYLKVTSKFQESTFEKDLKSFIIDALIRAPDLVAMMVIKLEEDE